MSTSLLILLSVVEALALVAVLAVALVRIRIRLLDVAALLTTLAELVGSVERDLRLIAPTVPKVNAPLRDIVAALPSIAGMAETVASR